MYSLNFIKKINNLKTITKVNYNDNNLINYDTDITYINLFDTKYFFKKNILNINNYSDKISLNFNYDKQNLTMFINLILNFLYLSDKMELSIYVKHNQNMNNILYSNYDISMIYNIAIKNQNIFNNNKTITLSQITRKPFRANSLNLFKKISIIDLLLKKYLESYLQDKISINFEKYGISFYKKRSMYLKIIRRRLRRMRKMLRAAKISLRSFIRISLIFLYTKDIDIFSKLLLKIMNSMHYKNHRRFLYYLKLFISKSMNYFFDIIKFNGFFFYLSGKISGGGNSKKKNYAIRCGKYSLTNKMLKLKFKKGLIYTKTGVLGYKIMISYS
uniref:Ymf64 n=1 Tax=Tetrahymena paravorax TaxID=5905 RepID=Q09F67_TETPR|nr:Ymf64 [Tetrahymena paravorax]ABI51684.1 Ymf64 [Tetrahymena paravorax]